MWIRKRDFISIAASERKLVDATRNIENLQNEVRNLKRRLNVMELEANEHKERNPELKVGDKAIYQKRYNEDGSKHIAWYTLPQEVELLKEAELGWYVVSDFSDPFFAHHSELTRLKSEKAEVVMG